MAIQHNTLNSFHRHAEMVLPSTVTHTTARNNKRIRRNPAAALLLLCNYCCSDEKRGGDRQQQRQWRRQQEKQQVFSITSTKSLKKGVKFTSSRATIIFCVVTLSLGLFWVYYQANKIKAEQNQQQLGPQTFDFFKNDARHDRRHASPPSPPRFTIFYNIFIPNDKAGIQHALKIVKEQVEQVKKSSAVSVSIKTILYYNTIGHLPNELQETHMQRDICGLQLSCRHMKHYEEATEAVTLQNLYDYCHQQQQHHHPVDYYKNLTTLQMQTQRNINDADNDDDEDIRVIYLHSKGSYHKNAVNDKWRRYLTMAATHYDCLYPFSSSSSSSSSTANNNNNNKKNVSSSCDVCGLHFFTEWTLFYPGNMFSAKCAYIRQLVAPNEFEQAMERAIGEALWMRLSSSSNIQMKLFPDDRLDRYGLDRYATEHWIGSHPNLIRPCDVAPTEIPYRHWFTKKSKDISMEQLHGALAPRYRGAPADNIATNMSLFWEQEENKLGGNGGKARIREYFYLAGHLIKWYSLYNQAPPMDSYVWDWFPDGAAWKRAVQEYGPRAVQVMTAAQSSATDGAADSQSVLPKPPQHPASLFVDRTSSSSIFATRSLSSLAIFFQIDRRLAWNQPMHVTEQLQVIVESVEAMVAAAELVATGSVALYYQILGPTSSSKVVNADDETQLLLARLCSETRVFDCVELPSQSAEYEGETIQHLHDYCSTADDDADRLPKRVVYLHNKFQVDDRYSSMGSSLWKTAAQAAMGIPCLQSTSKAADNNNNNNKCNLCGYQFETWSEFHMAENMWTASCSYIQRLVSPKDYVALRQKVAKRAMVLKAKNRLTMTYFHGQTTRENLGIDRYALPYWVASHPMVEPCDVAPSSSSLGSTTDHGQGLWLWIPEKLLSSTKVASTSKLHYLRRQQGHGESNHNATRLDTLIRNDIGLRTREWCFFAGHALRWGEIYNDTTPPLYTSSWIWNDQQGLLPDAQEWLTAIHQYGYSGAVDFMTRPFANTKV